MSRLNNLLGRSRRVPCFPLAPGVNSLTACTFLLQVQPAVRHGLNELTATNSRHVLIEIALMSYLMGMGFDYRTAHAIVETWESDEQLLLEGILSE